MLTALSRGKAAVDEHIALAEEFDSSWREETASEILWVHTAPFVRYADFTRREENAIGADWLWWWVDADGYCFGALVQAKRIHYRGDSPQLNLRANGGQQMRNLFEAADIVGVPAAYLIYSGRAQQRREVCRAAHDLSCNRCARLSIALFPALEAKLAAFSTSQRDAANSAYSGAVPIEDLADTTTGHGAVYDLNLDAMEPGLRNFLRHGQAGARHVARTIFSIVAKSRLGQFSATTTERRSADETASEMFSSYPGDVAHYGVPYISHILRGLRSSPPAYVADVLAGRPLAQTPAPDVAGIVIVQS